MNIKRTRFAFIFLILFFSMVQAVAQRYYFNETPTGNWLTSNPKLASDGNMATAATLNAPIVVPAWIKLISSQKVPAGVTTFIKVDAPSMTPANFQTLFTVEPYQETDKVPITSIKLVQRPNESFVAVTSSEPFNSVRITYDLSGSWFGIGSMQVYDAFFGSDLQDCGSGWSTSFVTSSTIANTPSSVSNATYAVDANSDSYSTIFGQSEKDKLITVSQTIYFSRHGSATDVIRLYLNEPTVDKPSTEASASVLAYLDEKATLSGKAVPSGIKKNNFLEYVPGEPFDRVTITIQVPAKGNSSKNFALEVYNVQVVPATPVLSASSTTFCEDASESLSITNHVAGLEYRWSDGTSPLTTSLENSLSLTELPPGLHNLSVTASRPGCTESSPATVSITVNQKPIKPEIKPY